MSHARFVTPYRYIPDEDVTDPAITKDFTFNGEISQVVTRPPEAVIPPSPNLTIVQIEAVPNSTLQDIIDHPDYGAACILYTHQTDSQVMQSEDFDALADYLIANGMTFSQVVSAIGTAPNGRPRFIVANDLRGWLETNY